MTTDVRRYWKLAILSPALMAALAFANHWFNADRRNVCVLVCFAALFCTLVASLVPLALELVLRFQVRMGNAEHPLVRWLLRHQRRVVRLVWAIFALGLLVALPFIWSAVAAAQNS